MRIFDDIIKNTSLDDDNEVEDVPDAIESHTLQISYDTGYSVEHYYFEYDSLEKAEEWYHKTIGAMKIGDNVTVTDDNKNSQFFLVSRIITIEIFITEEDDDEYEY